MKKVGFVLLFSILLTGSYAWALDSEIIELREKALIDEIEHLEAKFQWRGQPQTVAVPEPKAVPQQKQSKKLPAPKLGKKKHDLTKESLKAKLALKEAKARKKQLETQIMLLEKKLAVSRHLAERSVNTIQRTTRQIR